MAVAVPNQNVGGHIVGASAVVDRRCADPRGGGDLAELGQIDHRCEAALSRNRRDKVADLNGIAASLFNRLPSAEIDRDKLVVDRSAGDIRTVRSALGLYHAAIKRRTAARAAQRDQVDLAAAVRAGVNDLALRNDDLCKLGEALELAVHINQRIIRELSAAERSLADIQVAARTAGFGRQADLLIFGSGDTDKLAAVFGIGPGDLDDAAAAEHLELAVGIHNSDRIRAGRAITVHGAGHAAVACEQKRHGLAGLEFAQALLRRGQDSELRSIQHRDAARRAGRGIAGLIIHCHARIAGIKRVRRGVIGNNIISAQGGNGAEHAVAVNGEVRSAARQSTDTARGLIRRKNNRRIAHRRTCRAAYHGNKGQHLAVRVEQQVSLESVEHRGGAWAHKVIAVLLPAGDPRGIAVEGYQRYALARDTVCRVVDPCCCGCLTVLIGAAARRLRAEHIDEQLRRLRAGNSCAACKLHARAHAGGLGKVNVALRPNAARGRVRIRAEQAHENGHSLAVADGAIRLEGAVRQACQQLFTAHGIVDIAGGPVARAHIGEDRHRFIAQHIAAAHQCDQHLAKFRAGELRIGIELPDAVALDHAEQPQHLHVLRRLFVRHIGEAACRRGGKHHRRERQHKSEQRGKYSLFHSFSPLIPPAALPRAGASMP